MNIVHCQGGFHFPFPQLNMFLHHCYYRVPRIPRELELKYVDRWTKNLMQPFWWNCTRPRSGIYAKSHILPLKPTGTRLSKGTWSADTRSQRKDDYSGWKPVLHGSGGCCKLSFSLGMAGGEKFPIYASRASQEKNNLTQTILSLYE